MQAFKKSLIVVTKRMAKQNSNRFGAFGGQVRQIARDKLPRDIVRVSIGKPMRSLCHAVMRQDQRFTADL